MVTREELQEDWRSSGSSVTKRTISNEEECSKVTETKENSSPIEMPWIFDDKIRKTASRKGKFVWL